MSVKAIDHLGGIQTDNLHSNMGLAVLFSTCGIVVLGFLTWTTMLFMESPIFKALRFLQVRTLHKLLGYALITLSQITILTGVMAYNDDGTGNTDSTLGAINLGIFFFGWAILEIWYQFKTRAISSSASLDNDE